MSREFGQQWTKGFKIVWLVAQQKVVYPVSHLRKLCRRPKDMLGPIVPILRLVEEGNSAWKVEILGYPQLADNFEWISTRLMAILMDRTSIFSVRYLLEEDSLN